MDNRGSVLMETWAVMDSEIYNVIDFAETREQARKLSRELGVTPTKRVPRGEVLLSTWAVLDSDGSKVAVFANTRAEARKLNQKVRGQIAQALFVHDRGNVAKVQFLKNR